MSKTIRRSLFAPHDSTARIGLRLELLEDRTVPAYLSIAVTSATVDSSEFGSKSAASLGEMVNDGDTYSLSIGQRTSPRVEIRQDYRFGESNFPVLILNAYAAQNGTSPRDTPSEVSATAATIIRVQILPSPGDEIGQPVILSVDSGYSPQFGAGANASSGSISYSGEGKSGTVVAGSGPTSKEETVTFPATIGAEWTFTARVSGDSKVDAFQPGTPGHDVPFSSAVRAGLSTFFSLPQRLDFVAVENADPATPDKFLWNTLEDGGGFTFTYAVNPAPSLEPAPIPDTVIEFYWAKGPKYEDRIAGAMAYKYIINDDAKKAAGRREPISVSHDKLFAQRSPPMVPDPVTGLMRRATYLIMAIDPARPGLPGAVPEQREDNNVAALKVTPLVVNVVTHGFDNTAAILPSSGVDTLAHTTFAGFVEAAISGIGIKNQSDPGWFEFRRQFAQVGAILEQMPESGSILDGRVATYVTEWDSSSGFLQAFAYRMLSVLAQAAADKNRAVANGIRQLDPGVITQVPPTGPAGDAYLRLMKDASIEDEYVRVWQQKIEEYKAISGALANATAFRVFAELTGAGGLLGGVSFTESTRLQRVQFIGHSRGAAVNAGVSTLLNKNGFRNIVYFGSLDGFAADFADKLPLIDGKGLIFSDIAVSSAVVANVAGAMKVNYRVEQGLESAIFDMIDVILRDKVPYLGQSAVSLVLDPLTRKGAEDGINLRAQAKTGGWENATLRRTHGVMTGEVLTSHVNAVPTYLDSDPKSDYVPKFAPGDQYITDNYLGWHRTDGTSQAKPLQHGQFRRDAPVLTPAPLIAPEGLVADSQGGLFRLDPAGGAPSRLGRLPFVPFDLAVGPDGTAYALAPEPGTSVLYRLTIDGASVTSIRVGPLGAFLNALEFRADGTLLAAGQDRLYRVDPATGAAIELSRSPFPVLSAGDLAFGPGSEVYLTSDIGGGQLIRVSPDLTTWSLVGSTGVPGLGGLQFVSGTLIGYGPEGAVYRIDRTSGEALPIGTLTGVGTAIGAAATAHSVTRSGFSQYATGADAGGAPTVRFFDPDGTVRAAGNAFDPTFKGGVRVATADFNGDGVADIIVGTGPGIATQVRILDGATQAELFSIAPFEASFVGGVYVSAGDVTGDGIPDLAITPDEGGGPRVDIYSGAASFPKIAGFFGIDDPNFRGGARSAIADMTGDGVADLIVVAGFGGGPRVAAFDGKSLATTPVKIIGDFFAFEQALRNGIFVTAGDINGDGFADLIAGGGPGGGPRVLAFDGKSLLKNEYVNLANFFGGDVNSRGGIRVAVKNLDGDTKADLVVGSGSGAGSRVTGYLGKNITPNGTPASEFDFDAMSGFTGGVFVG